MLLLRQVEDVRVARNVIHVVAIAEWIADVDLPRTLEEDEHHRTLLCGRHRAQIVDHAADNRREELRPHTIDLAWMAVHASTVSDNLGRALAR